MQNEIENEIRVGDGDEPFRIIEYLLLLCLVVGFGYLNYVIGFHWSYSAGIVIPLKAQSF